MTLDGDKVIQHFSFKKCKVQFVSYLKCNYPTIFPGSMKTKEICSVISLFESLFSYIFFSFFFSFRHPGVCSVAHITKGFARRYHTANAMRAVLVSGCWHGVHCNQEHLAVHLASNLHTFKSLGSFGGQQIFRVTRKLEQFPWQQLFRLPLIRYVLALDPDRLQSDAAFIKELRISEDTITISTMEDIEVVLEVGPRFEYLKRDICFSPNWTFWLLNLLVILNEWFGIKAESFFLRLKYKYNMTRNYKKYTTFYVKWCI